MPCWEVHCNWRWRNQQRKRAHREVLEKFPGIIVGSTGYERALANRMRRLGA